MTLIRVLVVVLLIEIFTVKYSYSLKLLYKESTLISYPTTYVCIAFGF